MLRDYEILFIVRPELDEQQLAESVESVNQLIGSLGGVHQKTDVWGRRRLAYEVRHLREGQYVLTDFQIDPARVPEMEGQLKISETVFRHLVVRKPERKQTPVAAAPAEAGATQPEAAEAEPDVVPAELEPAAVAPQEGEEEE